MSATSVIADIIALVTDRDLKAAITHPDWNAAYEALLQDTQDDSMCDDDEGVQLLRILRSSSFGVDEMNRLTLTAHDTTSFESVWIDDAWVPS